MLALVVRTCGFRYMGRRNSFPDVRPALPCNRASFVPRSLHGVVSKPASDSSATNPFRGMRRVVITLSEG